MNKKHHANHSNDSYYAICFYSHVGLPVMTAFFLNMCIGK